MIMKADKKRLMHDILAVFFLLAVGFALLFTSGGEDGSVAEIRVNGTLYGSYSLDDDEEIPISIDGKVAAVAVIKDGEISMKSSNCNGGDCVKRGAVHKKGDCIICAPLGIGIYIGGGALDGVTG